MPVLLVAIVIVLAVWPTEVLELRTADGQLVKSIPVSAGSKVVYAFTHSVQKSRVTEVLEVSPNAHLTVRETIYEDTGAGLPSDLPDGKFSTDSDGKFHISGMNRDLPVWPVRVAFTAQQTVQVGGETFRLDSLAPPTTLIDVSVATRSRLGLHW